MQLSITDASDKANPFESSRKPVTDYNKGLGYPHFISHEELHAHGFIMALVHFPIFPKDNININECEKRSMLLLLHSISFQLLDEEAFLISFSNGSCYMRDPACICPRKRNYRVLIGLCK